MERIITCVLLKSRSTSRRLFTTLFTIERSHSPPTFIGVGTAMNRKSHSFKSWSVNPGGTHFSGTISYTTISLASHSRTCVAPPTNPFPIIPNFIFTIIDCNYEYDLGSCVFQNGSRPVVIFPARISPASASWENYYPRNTVNPPNKLHRTYFIMSNTPGISGSNIFCSTHTTTRPTRTPTATRYYTRFPVSLILSLYGF